MGQTKLKTLDVGNNMIEEIEGVAHLTELEEFWVSDWAHQHAGGMHTPSAELIKPTRAKLTAQASGNQIPNLRALDTQLAHLQNLETVYLEGNPCQTNDRSGYRRKVMLALPQVKQIDATWVPLRFGNRPRRVPWQRRKAHLGCRGRLRRCPITEQN